MARYVLVEFDDNDEADNFVQILNGGDFDGHTATASPGSMRVRAVWFKPTKFCDCKDISNGEGRGKKYGMWAHKTCGKPRKGVCQHPRNLLEPADMPVKYRAEYLGIYEPSERGGLAFERGEGPPAYKEKWK